MTKKCNLDEGIADPAVPKFREIPAILCFGKITLQRPVPLLLTTWTTTCGMTIFVQGRHVAFDCICHTWNTCGEHQVEHGMVHWSQINTCLLILGCFCILAKGTASDLVDKATQVSHQSMHSFFASSQAGLQVSTSCDG